MTVFPFPASVKKLNAVNVSLLRFVHLICISQLYVLMNVHGVLSFSNAPMAD